MISLKRQRWIAASVAALLGGSALLLYLPSGAESANTLELVILDICTPGWLLAYAITGGVHAGHMAAFPALTAIFTGLLWFGAITLALGAFRRHEKARP